MTSTQLEPFSAFVFPLPGLKLGPTTIFTNFMYQTLKWSGVQNIRSEFVEHVKASNLFKFLLFFTYH